MKFCPNCGAENEDDSVECLLCGYIFDDFSVCEEVENSTEAEETDYTDESIFDNDELEVNVNNDIPLINPAQAPFSSFQQQTSLVEKKIQAKELLYSLLFSLC